MSRKKKLLESHIITALLAKLFGQDGLILASFSFCEFMDLSPSRSINTKKELGQYPAILTSHLVNNPYFCNSLSVINRKARASQMRNENTIYA